MKNLLIIVMALLLALPTVAQNRSEKTKNRTNELPLDSIFPITNGKILYTEVFDTPDTTINDIYLKAKLWFADNFKDAKSVIQVDDKENGIIKGKGVWDFGDNHYFYYTITVKFKLGKAKYEIADILHSYDGYIAGYGYMKEEKTMEDWLAPKKRSWLTPTPTEQQQRDTFNKFNSHFIVMASSLKKSLTSKPDTDW